MHPALLTLNFLTVLLEFPAPGHGLYGEHVPSYLLQLSVVLGIHFGVGAVDVEGV